MAKKLRIGILGVGRGFPEHVLNNSHLEKIVDTSNEWIVQRTGIWTRRVLGPGENILQLSVKAAKDAIKLSNIKTSKIRYIRIGVNTHLRFPSLAVMVQKELGIKNCSAVDVSAGCAGFIFAVDDVHNQMLVDWVLRGELSYGLVIGVDGLSLVTDYTDRSTCVLFGDGAGAAIIGPVESGEILATYTRTQAQYTNLLYLDEFLSPSIDNQDEMIMKSDLETNYPFLRMDGKKTFAVAVRTMISDIRTVIDRYNKMNGERLTTKDVDFVIPHQANLRIIAAVQNGLKLQPEQVYRNGVINYGNISAATIPIGYVEEWGKRPGALEVDVAFGSGFASGAILRRVREGL